MIGKLLSLSPLALLPWDERSSRGNKDRLLCVFIVRDAVICPLWQRDTLDTDDVQYVLRWWTTIVFAVTVSQIALLLDSLMESPDRKASRSSPWLQYSESWVRLLTYRTERRKICFPLRLRWLVTMVAGNEGNSVPDYAGNVLVAKGTEVETDWELRMR